MQYADFAVWQRSWLRGDVLERQLEYWRRQLEGLENLRLPSDRPRPACRAFRGRHESFVLPQGLATAFEELGRRCGAALFMTLLAAFQAVLHRLTGQDDIVVGSPIANRTQVELESLIGFFVNSLAMRSDLGGDPTFDALVPRVRDVALAAYAHQDLPFEKLVEDLDQERDPNHNPFFQVMFVLQNAPRSVLRAAGLEIERRGLEVRSTRFDLDLHLSQLSEGLRGTIFYDLDLFDPTTVRRLHCHFRTLLESAIKVPSRPLSALAFLAPAEIQQLREHNDTASAWPRDAGLAELRRSGRQRSRIGGPRIR